MTLVNVGQKGKVSTQKFIVTYFATLSSTEAEEQCEEGIASKGPFRLVFFYVKFA